MATTNFSDHLLSGDHASRPAATAVPEGTLYACTDHGLIYQSDGSAWSTWATLSPSGGSGTFVRRVYQSLTTKSTWSAIGTDEQWGTEEATLDDALLPSTSDVTVYASVRGHVNGDGETKTLRVQVEISLDGGSTWNAGTANWWRHTSQNSNDRMHLFTDHQVTGTVTGDIQVRVMAQLDDISPVLSLVQGFIAMEVLVDV